MKAALQKRLEALEDLAGMNDNLEPVRIIFVNPDGEAAGELVLTPKPYRGAWGAPVRNS